MSKRPSLLRRLIPRGETGLAKLSAILMIIGAIVSGVELVVSGHITPPALALDVIGVTLLPYGLLSMCIAAVSRRDRRDPPADDDGFGGGGGSPDDERQPLPPTGGLQIDWQRFEADFHVYAESLTRV